jgi:2-iminobutanoate/2-iminopropanoate deaminase
VSGHAREIRAVVTTDAPPPGGAYSQAIEVDGWVFVSGQTPRDLTREVVPGTFEVQARQTLDNVKAIVEAGGLTMADAVRVTVYLRDIELSGDMDAVYAEYFVEPRPARTTVQSDLAVPIEVDVTLARGAIRCPAANSRT